MSLYRKTLEFAAGVLQRRRKRVPLDHTQEPRILIIRRNRMGDMLNTLPLFHALKRHIPKAHITVVCDPPGAPIAQACSAVNDVLLLNSGWNGWQAMLKNAWHLQDFDWVIAAKGGFDRRQAALARLTNAAVRVGFEKNTGVPSSYYTEPVELPPNPHDEHQIDTLLRLLKPFGVTRPTAMFSDMKLKLPPAAIQFAAETLSQPPFTPHPRFLIINFSSTAKLKFREEDFISISRRVLNSTDLSIAVVAALRDQQTAHEVAECMGTKRIVAVQTPSPLDLAALMEHAAAVFTPEGGAAHLAAVMDTPALVLWSEGPFKKWASRGRGHAYVHAEPGETVIPVDRVWTALQPYLGKTVMAPDPGVPGFPSRPKSVD